MNNKNNNNNNSQQQQVISAAYTTALLRSLEFQGIQFLRFVSVDVCNNIRCKVRPVSYLLQQQQQSNSSSSSSSILENSISIATVCYAGLPYYADSMIPNTGMDAKHVEILQPDLNSFRILPYGNQKSAVIMTSFMNQYTHQPSKLCTRTILQSILIDAKNKYNIGFNVGIELEFCLVDASSSSASAASSSSSATTTTKTTNFHFVDNSVFANTDTLNEQDEFISELYDALQKQYIPIELIHSESGPGQLELVLKYNQNAIEMADNVILAKETIKAVAKQFGLKALFIPKYDLTKAGNGMHIHLSTRNLSNNNTNTKTTGRDADDDDRTFCDGNTLTKTGGAFVEGILSHLPALLGLSLPTVNSFRRIGPGCWTGSVVGWNVEDKECGVRVCSNLQSGDWDHVEYKLCDSTCNIYLALSGILSAGLDGIDRNMVLREPLDDMRPTTTTAAATPSDDVASASPLPLGLPDSVTEALDALEKDDMIMNNILGGNEQDGANLGKAYLALRRNEAERSHKMTLEEEVKEFISRA